jgi:hypothetical protein
MEIMTFQNGGNFADIGDPKILFHKIMSFNLIDWQNYDLID